MTAMNLIVQRAAGSAYLLTDAASISRDGMLHSFVSKVLPIDLGPGAGRVAITASGAMNARDWVEPARQLKARSVTGLLQEIPDVFRAIEARLIDSGAVDRCGETTMAAVVASFDHGPGDAGGHVIGNDNSLFDAGWYESYSLRATNQYVSRVEFAPYALMVNEPWDRGGDITQPEVWDPVEGAACLIEAQRHDPFMCEAGVHYGVGGVAVLTTVGAAGTSHTIVRSWPDRPGTRIDATAPPRLIGRIRSRWNRARIPAALPTIHLN